MNAIVDASAVPASGPKLDNRRVLAALIDLALVAVVGAAVLAAAGALGGSPSEVGVPLAGVLLGWTLYYYFACESGGGQTVGKRLMGIRVVLTDGSPAGMREIALRTVLRIVDMQFVYLVGLIVMLATGERRGRLGDLVAGTMVVSAERPSERPGAVEPAEAVAAPRIPIAESGPAFEPVAKQEPELAELASPSLQELASDVTAVTSSPERAVEEQPQVEEQPEPVVEIEASPSVAEALDEALAGAPEEAPDEPPVEEAEAGPAAEAEQDESEEVVVKSVETVSAIDLVMEDSARER